MKKLLFLSTLTLLFTSFLFTACLPIQQAPDNGGQTQPIANRSETIYLGNSTETIEGIDYSVESYAVLPTPDPYFYTYYKYYYLNGKLRRSYKFIHEHGCDRDYKYDEFVEHQCGVNILRLKEFSGDPLKTIMIYNENEKVEHIYFYTTYGTYFEEPCEEYILTYYENGNLKSQQLFDRWYISNTIVYKNKSKKSIDAYIDYSYDSYTDTLPETYLSQCYKTYDSGFIKFFCQKDYDSSNYKFYTFDDNILKQQDNYGDLGLFDNSIDSKCKSVENYTKSQAESFAASLLQAN